MKRLIVLSALAVGAGFGFEWGIYAGPEMNAAAVNMGPVETALSSYEITGLADYQLGLSVPVTLRLWRLTLDFGDFHTWQSAPGNDWRVSFHHSFDRMEFGYVVDLAEHLRIKPLVGMGDYTIHMRLAETGAGFGSPSDGEGESRYYDYENFSVSSGLSVAYYWKFENRVVVGLEAKARYLVPLQSGADWEADGGYSDVYVPDFYPHTPLLGVNFFVGYERLKKDEAQKAEEDWEKNWEEE